MSHSGTTRAGPTEIYLDFDGSDFVEISDSDDLDLGGGAFTVSAWIKPTGWGQNDQGRIVDHGGGSSGDVGWTLQLENKSGLGFPQAMRMQINNSSQLLMSEEGAIALGIWQHVAVTFDNGTLRFFIDGVERGVWPSVPVPSARNSPIRIGGRATDGLRGFEGAIDEIRIWSRALSQQEIRDGMFIELSGSEIGLLAYLPINENVGQVAGDLTTNVHNGTLGSGASIDGADPEWLTDAPLPNTAPVVDAGDDLAIALPVNTVSLNGMVSDDGQPNGLLNLSWSKLSGGGVVSIGDPSAASTTATFVDPGVYVLQLTASDTILETSDQLTVTVYPAAVLTSIEVTPDPAVLLKGDTVQFTATGLDQTGQAYSISPEWNGTGGSMSPGGLYTAGAVTGQFQVTASADSVVGQAEVIIVDDLGAWPTIGWETAIPADMGMDQSLLEQARDYALTSGGAGMITRHGRAVLSWGDTTTRHEVKSVTKSIGALMLGLAIRDNLVTLNDLAQTHYPNVGANPASNVDTGWLDEITILHLATHTAGFDKPSGYTDILFQPGTTWAYSDGGVNWLADTLTVTYQGDLLPILREQILNPLGVPTSEVTWTDSSHRDLLVEGYPRRELNSSIQISVDAMARLGYLALRGGTWDGQSIIPTGFIDQMRAIVPSVVGLPVGNDIRSEYAGASDHYGILWWNNADGALPNVPRDAFWAWGLGDYLIFVVPSLDIVATRAGTAWAGNRTPSYYAVIAPFFDPIVQSVSVFDNQVPTVNAGLDETITLPTDTVNLNGSVVDDGLPNGTLEVSWSLVDGPDIVTFSDSSFEDTSATFAAAGVYILRLTASDGLSSASDDVLVTVLPEPDTEPPVVVITLPANGATVSGAVSVIATATDNNNVSSVEFFAAGSSIGIDTSEPYGSVWNSTVEVDGAYDVTAVARDSAGNEGGDSIIVNLSNSTAVNQAPVVDAGVDSEVTLPTNTVSLTGSVVDDGLPAGSVATNWTAIDPPFPVSFADASATSTDVTFGGPGIFRLMLSADDGLLSASDETVITVQPELFGVERCGGEAEDGEARPEDLEFC